MTQTHHRSPVRASRFTAAARACAAGIGLLVLLLAPPPLLIHFIGDPAASFARFSLTTPLTDGEVEGLLAAVIWVAWAQLVVCVLAETRAQLYAHRRAPGVAVVASRVPLTFGFQQRLARQLVVAVLAFVSLTPAVAGAASAAPAAPVATSFATASYTTTADATPTGPASRVVVRPGEDLSALAEQYLGSATQWPAIWDANQGSAEPNGAHFTDPNLIKPGWTLRLPNTQDNSPTAAMTVHYDEVTVARGDTLWSLAETHLGAGDQWPRIWALTQGIPQPDGHLATDPSRIRVGWTVRIPIAAVALPGATAGTPSAPAPADAGSPRSSTEFPPHASSSPTPAPSPTSAAQQSETAATAPADPDVSAESSHSGSTSAASVPVGEPAEGDADSAALQRTGLGLSVLAAAAVVGAVGRRRITQQRRRRIGRRIAMPSGDTEAAELELRLVENAEVVRLLDLAARTLMLTCQTTGEILPPVGVVRLFHRGVELLLTEPAPAIEPFIAASPTMWRFDAATAGHLLVDDAHLAEADISFPWPLLVTIGVDERGPVMVNLETAGALTVVGEQAHTGPVLAAAAVELATSSLSAMARVQLVGVAADLAPAAEAGRATTHADVAAALAEPARFHRDTAATLRASGFATMHESRTAGQADLTFPSHAVVCAGPLSPAARQAVINSGVATPGFGTGIITTDDDAAAALPGWVLRPSAALQLQLEPFGLTVHPQQLREHDLATVGDLLRVSGDLDDVAPADPAWAAAANISYLSVTDRSITPTTIDLHGKPNTLPESPLVAPASGDSGRAALDEDSSPMIRVLGPVTITGARGEPPGSRQAKAMEIAAFLALHPGTRRDEVTEAIWPTKRITAGHRQNQMWVLRSWLGTAPDGEPYVGSQAATGPYTLHPGVRCDWTEFATLAKRGFAAGVDGLADLEAALRYVRGRPFSGVRPGTYAFSEAIAQADIIPAIRDVADAVAAIRLAAGDPAAARAAAAIGLLADPASEQLLRSALRAAHLRGDHDDVANLVARLDRINDEIGDNDPETVELLALVLADQRS